MRKSSFSLLFVFVFGLGMSFVSADTLDDAITWMQSKGITNSTAKDTYKAENNVSRQASAKFVVQFAKAMKKKMTNYLYSSAQCAFSDVAKSNSLKPDILLSCRLGYITGKSKKFSPNGTFTIAQAVVTVMRIMEGRKNEKVTPWYKNYFDAATKKGYLSGLDITNPNKAITRGELGLFLYAVAKPAPVVSASTGSVSTGSVVFTGSIATGDMRPYQIRFIEPISYTTRVPLNGSVQIKLQAGENVKKITLSFIVYSAIPENNKYFEDVEVSVQSGYADYTLNVLDVTLVPITIWAAGISDDPVKDAEEESSLGEKDALNMFRKIQPYTNQRVQTFILEDDRYVINNVLVGQEKTSPNFVAGFSGFGLLAIPSSDIEFKIDVPSVLQIKKGPINATSFLGLKDGETKVTATYKGLSQDFFFTVGQGNP